MTHSLPDYSELSRELADAKIDLNPSQVHGLLCGLIVATQGKLESGWEKLLLGKKKNDSLKDYLQQLIEISYHQMSDFSFEFNLLLPDDSADISIRAENLGLWCQGFLTGLEQYNVPIKNREESEVTEALNDILEISQVSFDDTADDEENETSYFELIEYVRLAVLMIYQEFARPEDTHEETNLLH